MGRTLLMSHVQLPLYLTMVSVVLCQNQEYFFLPHVKHKFKHWLWKVFTPVTLNW